MNRDKDLTRCRSKETLDLVGGDARSRGTVLRSDSEVNAHAKNGRDWIGRRRMEERMNLIDDDGVCEQLFPVVGEGDLQENMDDWTMRFRHVAQVAARCLTSLE